jgi:DNA-binding transcriptional MocR family regulator
MVGPLGPEIVTIWMEEGVVDRTLLYKRREATRRQAMARRTFSPTRIQSHPSALHLWLKLPGRWGAERLAAEAASHHIVVTPSSAFWTRTSSPPAAVRIALGGVDDPRELARGLSKFASLALV